MKFRDDYYFLSNMYPCNIRVKINGELMTFRCAESAFQACKDPASAKSFAPLNGFDAKKLGKRVRLRPDWSAIRVTVMRNVVRAKFTQNPELANKLLATGSTYLVEDNEWGDKYWGVYNGQGENMLGKILMETRESLRNVR